MKTLKRILADIRARRNIEAYILFLLALVVAVLGIVDELDPKIQMAAILAALGYLVFQTTSPAQTSLDLDSVLQNRHSFGRFSDKVKGAREVWILAQSGINALRDDLKREILDKGGEMRILLHNPADPHIRYLREQIDSNQDAAANLDLDLSMALSILRKLESTDFQGKFEYRFTDYAPGFSMVVIDPKKRDGSVIVEFLGFRNEHVSERMHIEIHRHQSQHWFDYWVAQYEKLWQVARVQE
jgi:hypothetical protein